MSDILEIRDGYLINLDNLKSVERRDGKPGGVPSLLMTYMDCTSAPLLFDNSGEARTAYNKIKNSNKL